MIGAGAKEQNNMPHMGAAIDGVTAQVLGVEAFLRHVEPRSEAAIARWRQLPGQPFLTAKARREEIARQKALDRGASDEFIETLDADLSGLPTLERVFRRLDAGETLKDGDLFELKRFLFHATSLLETAGGVDDLPAAEGSKAQKLQRLMEAIHPESAPSARFHLSDQLDEKLADCRSELRKTRRKLKQRRNALEAQICGDYEGKFDFHGYFRHTAEGADELGESGAIEDPRLLARGDHYEVVDEELGHLKERMEDLREQVRRQEQLQRRRLTELAGEHRRDLARMQAILLSFEMRLTAVELRRRLGGCWPEVCDDDDGLLEFRKGCEPSLRAGMDEEEIQPIDLRLESQATVVLGPNMGGKSAFLRLVGLCQWCAQMALPVPAEDCRFAQLERIVYVGSEEPGHNESAEGLSSFGREVRRFVEFWELAGTTLWLLDEPGRGTHPEEGAKLAADIATDRLERGDLVVMATHFPLLAADDRFARLKIAGLTVDDDRLEQALRDGDKDLVGLQTALRSLMDYSVVPSDDGEIPRDARRVARALGLSVGES